VTADDDVDALIVRLEGAVARLSDSGAPIEELAAAYEEGLALLERAEMRLAAVAKAAGVDAPPPAAG
jgi:exodeoxyribonuclease VII small subunit